MKTGATSASHSGRARERGIMMVESLMYIALFIVIVGLAFQVVYRCWDFSKAVKRTTDDIARAVTVGETWRQDVRSATGPLRIEDSDGGQIVHISHKTGEVAYRFSEGALWRRIGENGAWSQVLASVKSSRMLADRRARVSAWRWELELATKQKGGRLPPLFSFEAVSQTATQP